MSDDFGDVLPGKPRSLFSELNNMMSQNTIEVRAENSWGMATKFFELLERHFPDEEVQKKLMMSWFKAVRDKDFRKFSRALKKAFRAEQSEMDESE